MDIVAFGFIGASWPACFSQALGWRVQVLPGNRKGLRPEGHEQDQASRRESASANWSFQNFSNEPDYEDPVALVFSSTQVC